MLKKIKENMEEEGWILLEVTEADSLMVSWSDFPAVPNVGPV